jgi:hypothetical protein
MRLHAVVLLAAALLTAATAAPSASRPIDASGRHDIGRLLAIAETSFDLDAQDAVILLDSLRVERAAAGAVSRTVHTIVWFATEIGLETYADVHVPYDSATGSVEVHDLRTWRDDRWWPAADSVSATAVVETTPGPATGAYDYASLRRTALLHDGVELPCIVETRYTVTEKRPQELGLEGLHLGAAADPTVRSAFRLVLAEDEADRVTAVSRSGSPRTEDEAPGVSDPGLPGVWVAGPVDRLGRPLLDDPTQTAPFVAWSTWGTVTADGWRALGRAFERTFEGAVELEGAPLDSLAERLEGRRGAEDRARAAAAYLSESTRFTNVDDGAWLFGPRTAGRTWATAYGHRMDRAVLACALLRAADLEAGPIWVGHRGTDLSDAPPALARFADLLVEVRGRGFHGTLDPASARLVSGGSALRGRSVFRPGRDDTPRLVAARPGTLEVTLRIEPDGDGGYTGRGYVLGTGWLAPYDSMAGLAGGASGHLASLARSVLAGAEVDRHGVAVLREDRVEAGFDVSVASPEKDDLERLSLTVGAPPNGLPAGFAPAPETVVPTRDTPIMLPAEGTQRIIVEIDAGDREIVRVPEPVAMENAAGRFTLTVERNGSWIQVARELVVDRRSEASGWPELRALLLEEASDDARTIILR